MHTFFCENCKQIVQAKITYVTSEDGSADPTDIECPACGEAPEMPEDITLHDVITSSDLCEHCNLHSKDVVYHPYCSAECVGFSHLKS